MTKNEWHIVGRGKAGWYADGVNVSSSGGNLEPYTYWTGEPCNGYAREAIDGALVYDAENAAGDAFRRLVISGPMKNCALAPFAWSSMGAAGERSEDDDDASDGEESEAN